MGRSLIWLALGLSSTATAGQVLEGDLIRITYDDEGWWNDGAENDGFEAWLDDQWVEFTYVGYPYQGFALSWYDGVESHDYYAVSWNFGTNLNLEGEFDDSGGTTVSSRYEYSGGDLYITKTETWEEASGVMVVSFTFENFGSAPAEDIALIYLVDPDQDDQYTGSRNTDNDALDLDGDGVAEWAEAAGPSTDHTIGFGACDRVNTEVGFWTGWASGSARPDTSETLTDPNGATNDYAMGLRWISADDLAVGDVLTASFIVVVDASPEDAQDAYAGGGLCDCDADEDGFEDEACGGDDCDDADEAVNPSADEIWYDGIDQDCAGDNDYDQDGDGYDSADHGGEDCDDTEGTTYPGAPDALYDGVDSDCDGASDYDGDGDGYDSADYGGEDCDDEDAAINPDADEIVYDGIDQDCDPDNDNDADGDGYAADGYGGDDCNDADDTVYPGAPDTEGDGVDSDCDGNDGPGDDPDDPGDTSDDDVIKGGGTCACTAAPLAGAWVLGLVPLLLIRRRKVRAG